MTNSRRAILRSEAGVGGLTAGSALIASRSASSAAAAGTVSGQTGWIEVRTDFGAKGDGTGDGTGDDTDTVRAARPPTVASS